MGKPHCCSIVRATDNSVWSILYSGLRGDDFEAVATVREALSRIATEDFDLTAFRPAHAALADYFRDRRSVRA
jgi:hypothetical protein